MENNFEELARVAASHARRIVPDLAPGGVLIGKEYTCAGVTGGKGTSCKFNVDTCNWADFATGEKGNDLISFWAASHGIKQGDAAKELANRVGFDWKGKKKSQSDHVAPIPKRQPETALEPKYNLVSIPDSIKQPTFFHIQHGAPSGYWLYHGRKGERLFWIARYDTPDGKQFTPYSYDANSSRIVPKSWPEPRPLYGLELLEQFPEAKVMVVEGEKACDAARQFVPSKQFIVVTWPGGSKAWSKVDWTPLYGREIVLWPDNDLKLAKEVQARKHGIQVGDRIPIEEQPGMQAMLGIAEILYQHSTVRYFSLHEVPFFGSIDGFDAADALAQGWTWTKFTTYVRSLMKTYEPPVVEIPIEMVNNEWVQGSALAECINAGLQTDSSGKKFHCNMANVARMIDYHPNLKGKVWFDDFHLRLRTNWRTVETVEWSDIDSIKLLHIFQERFGLAGMKESSILDGVRSYAEDHRKNEPRDWMESIQWDGEKRIESFLMNAYSADCNAVTYAASKNFWIAMVARIYRPGCKMDTMLVLEGDQGLKKSTSLREIAGAWFTENSENIASKDFRQLLIGKMIVEIPELSSLMKGSNQEEIKAILSDPDDYFRLPYHRTPQNFNRTCIFVGTTNDREYLDDPSGARRYWPVFVREIDIEYIKKNREQLFAEAVFEFKHGATWWEMPPEVKDLQESRRITDPWENLFTEWVKFGAARGINEVLLRDFATVVLHFEDKDISMAIFKRLSKVAKACGWSNAFIRGPNGIPARYWIRPK